MRCSSARIALIIEVLPLAASEWPTLDLTLTRLSTSRCNSCVKGDELTYRSNDHAIPSKDSYHGIRLDGISNRGACFMLLKERGLRIFIFRNAGSRIRRADQCLVGFGVWLCNSGGGSIIVAQSRSDHSSDRISIAQSVIKSLNDDR